MRPATCQGCGFGDTCRSALTDRLSLAVAWHNQLSTEEALLCSAMYTLAQSWTLPRCGMTDIHSLSRGASHEHSPGCCSDVQRRVPWPMYRSGCRLRCCLEWPRDPSYSQSKSSSYRYFTFSCAQRSARHWVTRD